MSSSLAEKDSSMDDDSGHDSVDSLSSDDRERFSHLETAVAWIRQEMQNLQNYDKEILEDLLKVRSNIRDIRDGHRKQLHEETRYLSTSTLDDASSEKSSSTPHKQLDLPSRHPLSPSPDLMPPPHLQEKNDEQLLQDFFGREEFGKIKMTLTTDKEVEVAKESSHLHKLSPKPQTGFSSSELSSSPPPPVIPPSHPQSKSTSNVTSKEPVSDVVTEMQKLRKRLNEETRQQLASLDRKYSPKLHHGDITASHSRQGSLDVPSIRIGSHSREDGFGSSHSRQGSQDSTHSATPPLSGQTGRTRQASQDVSSREYSAQDIGQSSRQGGGHVIPPRIHHVRQGSLQLDPTRVRQTGHTRQGSLDIANTGHVRQGSWDVANTGHVRQGSLDVANTGHVRQGSLDVANTGHVRQGSWDVPRGNVPQSRPGVPSHAPRARGHTRQGSLDNMPFPVFGPQHMRSGSSPTNQGITDRQKSPSPIAMNATPYDSYSLERTRNTPSRSPTPPPFQQYPPGFVRQGSAGSTSSGSGTFSPPLPLPSSSSSIPHHPLQQKSTSMERSSSTTPPLSQSPQRQSLLQPARHIPNSSSTSASTISSRPPVPHHRPKSAHDVKRRGSPNGITGQSASESLPQHYMPGRGSGSATVPKMYKTISGGSTGTHYSTTVIKGLRKKLSDSKLPIPRSVDEPGGMSGQGKTEGGLRNGHVGSLPSHHQQYLTDLHAYDQVAPNVTSPDFGEPEQKSIPRSSHPQLQRTHPQAMSNHGNRNGRTSPSPQRISPPNLTPSPQPYQEPNNIITQSHVSGVRNSENGVPVFPEVIQPYMSTTELRNEMGSYKYKPFTNNKAASLPQRPPPIPSKKTATVPKEQTWC